MKNTTHSWRAFAGRDELIEWLADRLHSESESERRTFYRVGRELFGSRFAPGFRLDLLTEAQARAFYLRFRESERVK